MKTCTPEFPKARLAAAAGLALALCYSTLAAAEVKGNVTYQGKTWNAADAIAYENFMGVVLAFSKLPWDRGAWADDGVFDEADVYGVQNKAIEPFFTIEIRTDGTYKQHQMKQDRFAPGEGRSDAGAPALKLQQHSPARVAGTFKFTDEAYKVDLSFDLNVLKDKAVLPFPGTPLAADGGAPGKALLATLAAAASGDIKQILALSPPDKRAQMQAASQKPDFAKLLAMQKAMTPTGIKISGGSALADRAWVNFAGASEGKPMTGTAMMFRADGQWYLRSLKTKQ